MQTGGKETRNVHIVLRRQTDDSIHKCLFTGIHNIYPNSVDITDVLLIQCHKNQNKLL